MMHALITGGAGFIGSHLSEQLLKNDWTVVALDDLSTGSFENLASLSARANFRFMEASIMDGRVLEKILDGVNVVFHLAAAVGVRLVIEDPVRTIETNVMGTELLLRAALDRECRIVLASTSEVYGKGSRIPFHEDDDVILGATAKSRWSYAASKLVDEFLGLAYHHSHGMDVAIARLFNTVGPRQTGTYGMVIPRLMEQALRGEPLSVYGSGKQTRCFCHVLDVVDALERMATRPEASGHVINLGSTEEISIRALAERIREVAKSGSPIEEIPYETAFGPGFEDLERRVPDISRARSVLGWSPQHDLSRILADVKSDLLSNRKPASRPRSGT